jgi:hypothetical protein
MREYYLLNESTLETFLIRVNDVFVQVINDKLDVSYYKQDALDVMFKSPEILMVEL